MPRLEDFREWFSIPLPASYITPLIERLVNMSQITRTVDQHHRTWRDQSVTTVNTSSEAELLADARARIMHEFSVREDMPPADTERILDDAVLGIDRCADTGDIVNLYLTTGRRAGDETRTEENPCGDHHWVTDFIHAPEGDLDV